MPKRGGRREGAGRKPLGPAKRRGRLIRALVTEKTAALIEAVATPTVSLWAAKVLERAAKRAAQRAPVLKNPKLTPEAMQAAMERFEPPSDEQIANALREDREIVEQRVYQLDGDGKPVLIEVRNPDGTRREEPSEPPTDHTPRKPFRWKPPAR